MLSIFLTWLACFIGGTVISVVLIYARLLLRVWLTNTPLTNPNQLDLEYILHSHYDSMDYPTFFVFNAFLFLAPILAIMFLYDVFIKGVWNIVSRVGSRYNFSKLNFISFLNRVLTRKA